MVDLSGFNIQWIIAFVIMALMLGVAHLLHWSWYFGKELPRLCSYIIGCGCILTAIIIYLPSVSFRALLPIISFFFIAGFVVFILYGADSVAANAGRERRERSKKGTNE